MLRPLLFLAAFALSCPASAERLRDFCADRPGKDTPACIVDPGHVMVEIGGFDYSRTRTSDLIETDQSFGDTLLRFGLTARSEVQLSFTPYSRVRTRDRKTGQHSTVSGAGDLSAAFKYSLGNPDGSGTSAAIQAFVVAPTGKDGVGSGGWEGGIIVPVSFELPAQWSLTLNPEMDLRQNEARSGKHVAWAGVASISHDLVDGLEASAEIAATYDDDPSGSQTQASFDLATVWRPKDSQSYQLDAEIDLGLTRDSPDLAFALGFARRF